VSRGDRLRTVLVLAVVIPLGLAGEWAFSRTGAPPLVLLGDLAVGWAFAAAGLVAWHRRRDRGAGRTGTLMVAEGISWFLTNLQGTGVAALLVVGVWLGALNEAILVHLLLAFPEGRLTTRTERVIAAAAYVLALGGGLAFVGVDGPPYDPYRCRGCTAGIPVTAAGERLSVVMSHAVDALGVLLGLAVVAVIVHRWARASAPGRRALAPAWLSLGACGLLILSHAVDASPAQPPGLPVTVVWGVTTFLELAVPLGFLALVLRMRMARAAVGELVLDLGPDPAPDRLREALCRALGDPSLDIGLWHDPSAAYVDCAGRPIALAGEARSATRIDHEGRPLAVILHDRALAGDGRLLDTIAAAARLGTGRQRQLEELRESRARIAASADAERRRLERDLHDGAQQRFVLLALTLGSALRQLEQGPDEAGLRATLAQAADELRTGLGELRELARGIHPAVLTERGLAAAVESLAARMPIPVDVAIAGRWPPAAEANAYFVVAEALTNVVRHARAARVRVTAEGARGRLAVEVADDGVGGADPGRGSGLRGIRDRLAAAGGTLAIESRAGAGTRIRAELPCE
jgi:signal transduction histidine kinase